MVVNNEDRHIVLLWVTSSTYFTFITRARMLKPLLRIRSMASLSIRHIIAGWTEPEVLICWPKWWSGWNGNENEVILSTSQWRERRDETLKAMNNHQEVVEDIRLRDLHPFNKDLSTSSCDGLSIDRIRGEGDAMAWTQGLDLGTFVTYNQLWRDHDILIKEFRERAREAGAEGGI